jgi:hypothetical protein
MFRTTVRSLVLISLLPQPSYAASRKAALSFPASGECAAVSERICPFGFENRDSGGQAE